MQAAIVDQSAEFYMELEFSTRQKSTNSDGHGWMKLEFSAKQKSTNSDGLLYKYIRKCPLNRDYFSSRRNHKSGYKSRVDGLILKILTNSEYPPAKKKDKI